jgi:calcineurin-like phosphoesterase family protein
MTTFYTSDPHFGHVLTAGHRGCFKYVDPNNKEAGLVGDPDLFYERFFKAWNKVVTPTDQAWILGDLTLFTSHTRLREVMDFLRSLPGTKHLVLGNHDVGHPMWPNPSRFKLDYARAFASVQTIATHDIAGRKVILSHFPYTAIVRDKKREDKLRPWRPSNTGKWLIHGHTHKKTITTPGMKMVHVGWDAWKRPVSQEEVASVIKMEESRG